MKVGIDARWIFKEVSGIGAYTRELIRQLALLDRDNEFVIFFNDAELRKRTADETALSAARNFGTYLLPFDLFSLRNQLRLPKILADLHIDVFHSTNYMIPLRAFPRNRPGRIRCVTTIHDLIPLVFPEYAPRSKKNRFFPLYRWIMHQVGMRSDIIITGSKSARDDVVQHLRIPAEREAAVLTIHDGVDARFRPRAAAAAQGGPRAGTQTVLWVGRPDPYKNVTGLIEAFARLRENGRAPVKLRLIGPEDDRYPEGRRLAQELGVEADIEWVGYVSDARLVQEYQRADVFVLPSRYEGFGLPVLEAMACGVPVICSNKGSLPEIAGEAALKVQPQDIVGLSEAMKRVLADGRMADDMRARGLQQAAKFTWAATARQTLDAYWKALA